MVIIGTVDTDRLNHTETETASKDDRHMLIIVVSELRW